MLHKKEAMIREQRTIEASRKNLLGPGGKLGVIVRNLGEEILQEASNMYETSYLPSWEEIDDDGGEMPTIESGGELIGLCYDGLRRGLHLTILYREDLHELTVHWQGNLVFRELGGELLCYVPHKDWEHNVDRIYEFACEKEKVKQVAYDKQIEVIAMSKHKEFLDEMRRKWGL